MIKCWVPAAVLPVLFIAACDRTNWEPSLFRDRSPENAGTGYVITDAKQRIILNVPQFREKEGNNKEYVSRRVQCAEPSPDVAQALSEAVKFAAEAKITRPDGTSGSGSLNFANSFASSIAQLGERLAVIQLLRDKMYRACEAYANGAVGASGYTLMLARLDKSMVTMLSTEMTAGAFGRSLASLGGTAASGGVDPEELEKAKTAVTTAANNLKAEALKEAKTDEEVGARKKKIDDAAVELAEANDKLFAIEWQTARTSAAGKALAASLGQISGGNSRDSSGTVPGSIVNLHRNYLDDHGLEPLIDACVVAMDAVAPSADARATVKKMIENTERQKDQAATLLARKSLDEKLYENIVNTLASQGTPFAAFCALRVMTATNHRHAFIRHFTTLKRDLRGSRITGVRGSNGDDAPVIVAPVEDALYHRCRVLAVVLAVNHGKPDAVKKEKTEFDSKECAAMLN